MPEQENGEPSYTPASFEKRTAAWVGIAYVLMMLFVVTFSIFTGGKGLPGTFPLLLIPVAAGAAVIAVHRQRKGAAPGGIALTVIIVALCVAAIALGLVLGGPALVYSIQNAYAPI